MSQLSHDMSAVYCASCFMARNVWWAEVCGRNLK